MRRGGPAGSGWSGVAGICLLLAGLAPMGLAEEDEESTIEVVIQDSIFHVEPVTLKVDQELTIVLSNRDAFEHGFTSSAFKGLEVRVETDAVVTYGKGIEGLYLEPGEEVSIAFTPTRSGKISFRCDIHPGMSGEVAYLTISAT